MVNWSTAMTDLPENTDTSVLYQMDVPAVAAETVVLKRIHLQRVLFAASPNWIRKTNLFQYWLTWTSQRRKMFLIWRKREIFSLKRSLSTRHKFWGLPWPITPVSPVRKRMCFLEDWHKVAPNLQNASSITWKKTC